MTAEVLKDEEIFIRAQATRRMVVRMVHAASCGHPGGPLGLADIFAVLYTETLNVDPARPDLPERDRLLISNGHVSAIRYASMKLAGFFKDIDELSFRRMGSAFQGHPSTRYLPEVENSSGSLGQGLSAAVGLSLGLHLQNISGRVYCCISDGECGEGMTWEAATAAAHYKTPIIGFMDFNGIQIDGPTRDVCDLGDLAQKFRSYNWKVYETDGHDIGAIRRTFKSAQAYSEGPQMIVFKTVLGKGISYMENMPGWHGKAPNDDELQQALKELA